MTSDLYIKPLESDEISKYANLTLSKDSGKWVAEIITHFHEEYPELSSLPVRVSFKRKEPEIGSAVGTLTIGHVTVPVIIDKFYMYDLDVAIIQERVYPFLPETLNALFKHPSAFSNLMKKDDPFKFHRIFRPELAEVYEKVSSVLDAISDSVTRQSRDNLLDKIENNPELKAGFEINETTGVLDKLASMDLPDKVFEKEAVSKALDRDIFTIEKIGQYEYKAILGNSGVDDRVEVTLEEDQITSFYEEMSKNANKQEEKQEKASFDSLIGEVSQSRKEKHEKYANFDVLAATEPQAGDFGRFEFDKKQTSPVNITKVAKVNGEYLIHGTCDLEPVKFQVLRGITQILPHEEEKNAFYLPLKTEFLPMAEKKANLLPEINLKHCVYTSDAQLYSFQGLEFEKYAQLGHSIQNVSESEAKWIMVQNGVCPEEMSKIALKSGQKYFFYSDLKAPMSIDAYMDKIAEKVEEITESADFNHDFLKVASVMEDETTVDAILSLNFLNKSNLQEFLTQAPAIEAAMVALARLLILVRVGLKTIPEDVVKKGMDNLSKVFVMLSQLRSVMTDRK